jgi:novel protein kinase C epsilon type
MSRYLFKGSVKIKIIEAESLKATNFSTRIFQNSTFQLSTYVNLDIDDLPIGRTTTKPRNQNPAFNEEFQSNITAGHIINMMVFHDSALPPDEFVANCSIILHDLNLTGNNDLWIDLEPTGRLHVNIELEGSFTNGIYFSNLHKCYFQKHEKRCLIF